MPEPLNWRQMLRLCWVFPVFIVWKLVLAFAFVLPMPANDAFFFDGAVVHFLQGGGYANPAIVRVFPICGSEVFSAYPPFYQAVLLPWMWLFGTSARSSVMLHATLVSVFALLSLGLLRRLRVAPAAANLGGLLLFGLTFHDRPDSVAQVLGLLSLHALLSSAEKPEFRSRWLWLCTLEITLCLATSLHIGAMYAAMAWTFALLGQVRSGERFPWPPLVAMAAIPLAIAGSVLLLWPRLWEGFSENIVVTPSFTGYRFPGVDDLLKVFRTAPALVLCAAALVLPSVRASLSDLFKRNEDQGRLWLSIFLPACFVVAACLFIVAANYIHVAAYPQVVAVSLFLAPVLMQEDRRARLFRWAALFCAALVSLRAAGLSTWGLACAADYGFSTSRDRIRRVYEQLPADSEVLVSSAYLYDLAGRKGPKPHHADWVGRFGDGPGAFRPRCLILSYYDYHRRYKQEIARLVQRGCFDSVQPESPGRVPVPDASPRLQRVLQHISWAPVIIHLHWADK